MSHRFLRKLYNETKDRMKSLKGTVVKSVAERKAAENVVVKGTGTTAGDSDWIKHLNKVYYTVDEMNVILDKFCDKFKIYNCYK
jgi:hypothetical protein